MFFLGKLATTIALAYLADSSCHRPAARHAQTTRRTKARHQPRSRTPVREKKAPEARKNLVEVAGDAGFDTLMAAVKAADLVETFQGPGPFTVFAPTDEAFARLPKDTLEKLLKPKNKQKLADILTYHVISGRVTAEEAFGLKAAVTVQGDALKIRVKQDTLKINDATVTAADVEATNGIIHVIDTVLLPPTE